MIRISWTEPEDSRIRPGHESVLIAPWSVEEGRRFVADLFGDGKIDVSIEEM